MVVEGDDPLPSSLIIDISNINVVNGKLQICTGTVRGCLVCGTGCEMFVGVHTYVCVDS